MKREKDKIKVAFIGYDLISDSRLFGINRFEFRLCHLLIIIILIISFSISVLIRCQPASYGFELNEYDPFFNYRATKYLVENGFNAYVNWHDEMSWYPQGRDIFKTSQIGLHFTTALLYKFFANGSSLYNFTIIFPVVIGALTTVVIFAFVRVISGTTAGLFASLFFAISPLINIRGTIGWFKSEPLGIFYGLLALYLLLSGLKSHDRKTGFGKLVGSGFFIVLGFSSWGGIQTFIIPIGLFIITLPFIRKDNWDLLWQIPTLVGTVNIVSVVLFGQGFQFVSSMKEFGLLGPTIFLVVTIFIQKLSKKETRLRNSLLFLVCAILIGGLMISSHIFFHYPSPRYLSALNPSLAEQNPLISTVSEHRVPTAESTLPYLSTLIPFAGLGIWLSFRRGQNTTNIPLPISIKNESLVFTLILGFFCAYVGSTLLRLEILSAISVIIFSSIGLSVITAQVLGKTDKILDFKKAKLIKISIITIIIYLLMMPTFYPKNENWISFVNDPPTILNGELYSDASKTDWLVTMNWIKSNTPPDAIILSWWDYGYWITTLGERKTLVDNAALSKPPTIHTIANMFLDSPEHGFDTLQQLHADYVVVYVAGERNFSNELGESYELSGGEVGKIGDMIQVVQGNSSKFLEVDGITPKEFFWQNTLLGKLIPFTPNGFMDFNSGRRSQHYEEGYNLIYTKAIKYSSYENGPLTLVYSSPSLNEKVQGTFMGVIVYKINHTYVG